METEFFIKYYVEAREDKKRNVHNPSKYMMKYTLFY